MSTKGSMLSAQVDRLQLNEMQSGAQRKKCERVSMDRLLNGVEKVKNNPESE